MGLGKTIQALAAAELMALLLHINRVLIISPTSLKYQWKGDIEKFTNREATVIEGFNHQRRNLYKNDSFFKMVNYELVWRDMDMIREWASDLIILDEAQRIKNWKTRTAKYIKQLESTFAIVLTGTPIENRIEELHSTMEFVDRHHFGPLYRFVYRHRVLDGDGKVVGYQHLESIRRSLEDVMIRRKKDDVLKQLPERIDKYFFVPMTKEQQVIHDENYDIVVRIVAKWRRYKFHSEAVTGAAEGTRPESLPLNQLLIKGAEFLTNLSQSLSQSDRPPQETIEKHLHTMIGKDETTGKTYLKIPMPEPEVVQGVFSALGGLLANFMRAK
jgi:SNF2 family DNA or RNA helicase